MDHIQPNGHIPLHKGAARAPKLTALEQGSAVRHNSPFPADEQLLRKAFHSPISRPVSGAIKLK